jgi:type I restriction enzyme, R subunit
MMLIKADNCNNELEQRRILVTHFNETVISVSQSEGDLGGDEFMRPYNERVNEYVLANQSNVTIYKLKTSQVLTDEDIKTLELVLFSEVGTKDEYKQAYHDTSIGRLIKSIVCLDQEVANERFLIF